MTDRELLELAAKAAGINGEWERNESFIQERYEFVIPYHNHGMLTGIVWNPLTDDGDALRLAVKLSIDVRHNDGDGFVDAGFHDGNTVYVIDCGGGRYAATRRAIVRAAAEIGKGMA